MRRLYVLSMMLGLTAVLMMVQGCGTEKIPGGTADADSEWAADRAAKYAIDESTGTHWSPVDSDAKTKDSWLSVTWTEEHKVVKVELIVNWDPIAKVWKNRGKDFKIQSGSEADGWVDIEGATGTHAEGAEDDGAKDATVEFDSGVKTKGIRLFYSTTYGNEPLVNELECYKKKKILGLF